MSRKRNLKNEISASSIGNGSIALNARQSPVAASARIDLIKGSLTHGLPSQISLQLCVQTLICQSKRHPCSSLAFLVICAMESGSATDTIRSMVKNKLQQVTSYVACLFQKGKQ